MSSNKQLIADFLTGLGSDGQPVGTMQIDERPVLDGWMSAYYDDDRGIGYTAVAYDMGRFLVRIDLTKDRMTPVEVGELAKKIIG